MRKKFTNHGARKTTVSILKKANIVRSDIAKVTGHRSINFLNAYDEADEEERRRLALAIFKWNYEEKQILAVSDITTTVASLDFRWQSRKKTNCLLHFRVLNLKDFFMNPAMTGSQEQTMMNSLCTKGKSVSKYCYISKTPRRSSTHTPPPPPPPFVPRRTSDHQSMVCPRVGGGGGGVDNPRELDSVKRTWVGNLTSWTSPG